MSGQLSNLPFFLIRLQTSFVPDDNIHTLTLPNLPSFPLKVEYSFVSDGISLGRVQKKRGNIFFDHIRGGEVLAKKSLFIDQETLIKVFSRHIM